MNFELGKEYIVKVSEEGIIPIEEFDSDRFYDKDHDDLDFLTDEEKIVVINNVLDKIRAEIDQQEKWLQQAGYNAYNVDIAFGAIKNALKDIQNIHYDDVIVSQEREVKE